MGLFSWLTRLFGGRRDGAVPDETPAAAAPTDQAASPAGAPAEEPAEAARYLDEFTLQRQRAKSYLRGVRRLVQRTVESRQAMFIELGRLYEMMSTTPEHIVMNHAGELGGQYGQRFHETLVEVHQMHPPNGCVKFHTALVRWLEMLEVTCRALSNARLMSDPRQLRNFRELLNDARRAGKQCNYERGELIQHFKLLPSSPRKVGSGVAMRARARGKLVEEHRRRHFGLLT